jgi:hypothetical protein
MASEEGIDLAACAADEVLQQYNVFVKAAEDEKGSKKEEEKKEEEEEKAKKAEEYVEQVAVAEAQKIASISSAEQFYAHLGNVAADAYFNRLEKLASIHGEDGTPPDVALPKGRRAAVKESLGDMGRKAKGQLARAALAVSDVDHPGRMAAAIGKGTAGAAALGAAAYGAKKLYDHHESSKDKQAFDYTAGKIAMEILAKDNWDLDEGAKLLNGVLGKEAAEASGHSEYVKQASAEHGPGGAIQARAWELLSLAGYKVGE